MQKFRKSYFIYNDLPTSSSVRITGRNTLFESIEKPF